MSPPSLANREWKKELSGQEFLVSTSIDKISIQWVNDAFESEDMYWAKRLPDEEVQLMLSQSLTLGLYKLSPVAPAPKSADSPSSPRTPSPTLEDNNSTEQQAQQIGMARFVTDYVTFAYLTDVFIYKEYRGFDLGKWLISCCGEVIQTIPSLRRAMLMTSPVVGKRFYSRELGFVDVRDEAKELCCMTRRTYTRPMDGEV